MGTELVIGYCSRAPCPKALACWKNGDNAETLKVAHRAASAAFSSHRARLVCRKAPLTILRHLQLDLATRVISERV